jgi:hypothetical protein
LNEKDECALNLALLQISFKHQGKFGKPDAKKSAQKGRIIVSQSEMICKTQNR